MIDTISSLKWRYAVQKFDSKKLLSKNKINTLKQAFNLTATSYGLQPIKLLVIQNKELQKRLVPYSFNQPQVAQASHVLIICIENQLSTTCVSDYFRRIKKMRGTSDNILNPFKESIIQSFLKKDI